MRHLKGDSNGIPDGPRRDEAEAEKEAVLTDNQNSVIFVERSYSGRERLPMTLWNEGTRLQGVLDLPFETDHESPYREHQLYFRKGIRETGGYAPTIQAINASRNEALYHWNPLKCSANWDWDGYFWSR